MHIPLAVFSTSEANRLVTDVTGKKLDEPGFSGEFNRIFMPSSPGRFVERDDVEPAPRARSHLSTRPVERHDVV